MSCERAIELMIDALVEPLDKQRQDELQEHIASCKSCAAEMAAYQDLWQQLDTVPIPEPRSGGIERLAAAVREEFGDQADSMRHKASWPLAARSGIWQTVAAAIGLIGVGAILAIGLDNFLRDTDLELAAEDARARFLFIMTATQEDPDMSGRVQAEVDAWLGGLVEQDIIESGFGINEGTSVGTPRSGSLLNGPVSGFMTIRAADAQEARRIALDSPIIAYGGLIEIREIDGNDQDQ